MKRLLIDARRARLRRSLDVFARPSDPLARRSNRRAALLIEMLLARERGEVARIDVVLSRLATLDVVTCRQIAAVSTSASEITLPATLIRALGALLCDVVHVLTTCCAEGRMHLYLAVSVEGEDLVIGLAAEGALLPVATRAGAQSLERACRLAAILGGCFVRGVTDGRWIVGVVVPTASATAAA